MWSGTMEPVEFQCDGVSGLSKSQVIIYIDIQQTPLSRAAHNEYVCQKKETTIYRCRYSKDVHRTKRQALTMASMRWEFAPRQSLLYNLFEDKEV